MRLLKKAEQDPGNYYYLVIEELNRGYNAPAIFGEIFQLLDRKDEEGFPAREVGESEMASRTMMLRKKSTVTKTIW